MAFRLQLEPNETLALQIAFKVSEKTTAFNFAVSDQALYWPVTKTFVLKGDPTCFKRIRNNEVSEVCVRKLPPYGLWLGAGLMVLAGSALSYLMYAPFINHEPGEHSVSGWPIAILVGGMIMPFAARGRLGLEVKTHNKTFRWKSPVVLDKASKQKIQATIEQIAAACEKSDLRVIRN
jgi:hypothetical protein